MCSYRLLRLAGMLAALILHADASAGTLTVCMGDRAYPQLFVPDHDGQARWLARPPFLGQFAITSTLAH